jgi:MFS-type transporter involved in bile tolerance (Atg22 family)
MLMSIGAGLLWWVMPGGEGMGIPAAFVLLLAISVAFAISEVFHNAMLPSVAPATRVGTVSGVAFALGNVGGLVLMVAVLFAFAMPGTNDWSFLPDAPLLGLDQSTHEHDRIVGPVAGLWMLLFTLPVLLFTPDGKGSNVPMLQAARQGIRDVVATAKQLRHYSNIAIYLFSRMLFIDGMVGVMTFGGVYASGTFGWGSTTLLIFGLCTSASAMAGAWIGGLLDDRLGSLNALRIAIGMSSLVLILLVSVEPDRVLYLIPVSTDPVWDFPYFRSTAEIFYFCTNQVFAMFFVTGLSASRTLMARISPQLYELYGFSEGFASMLKPDEHARKFTTVGTPVLGFEVRVIDDEGRECAPGEPGEIVAYGAGMLRDYNDAPEQTAALIWRDERGRTFIRSGDVGKLDADGFLSIVDRKKDMIVSGGFNVFPTDIEAVVAGHPDVWDAAVIGIPHDKWGETCLALVIARPGVTLDREAVKLWANDRLAKHQRLAAVEPRADFPRNALGKVIKRELRDPYWTDGAKI